MTLLGRSASRGQVSSFHEMEAQKVGNRKMGNFVSIVLCVGTAMLVFNGLISVYTRINMFTAGINQEYIKLIVKVIGISYVTEISSNICKENGFAALASAMEIYARISVAGLCIPVIVTLFEMVSEGIV